MSGNGKPEVKTIILEIPVFTGDVSDNMPTQIESRIHFKMMTPEQIEGMNRYYQGFLRSYEQPLSVPSHSMVVRDLMRLIHEAFQEQHGAPA